MAYRLHISHKREYFLNTMVRIKQIKQPEMIKNQSQKKELLCIHIFVLPEDSEGKINLTTFLERGIEVLVNIKQIY